MRKKVTKKTVKVNNLYKWPISKNKYSTSDHSMQKQHNYIFKNSLLKYFCHINTGVSIFGVILVGIFPNPNTDTLYAVKIASVE